jgi:multidrug resistance protein, MATE family
MNLVLAELILQINTIFVGRLNDEGMMAGIGLANSLIQTIPLSLTYGISGVLETLVSQAHGNKQYHLCGVYLNKQIFIISVLYVPISLLLWNSKSILVSYLG